ncbi:hypothetical protein FPG78_05135 [Cardinium endosymbiont of Dermatophagoides farinae]|nr:hypothetical protein FPG78_05135 [Cardinium endosymbiont of Dermatophagoides farinae]
MLSSGSLHLSGRCSICKTFTHCFYI